MTDAIVKAANHVIRKTFFFLLFSIKSESEERERGVRTLPVFTVNFCLVLY